jgi:hypothetical protein
LVLCLYITVTGKWNWRCRRKSFCASNTCWMKLMLKRWYRTNDIGIWMWASTVSFFVTFFALLWINRTKLELMATCIHMDGKGGDFEWRCSWIQELEYDSGKVVVTDALLFTFPRFIFISRQWRKVIKRPCCTIGESAPK